MGLYKLTLDDVMDKDIIDYIDSFPRMRKSEMVRQAIREHMARAEGGQVVIPAPPTPPTKIKQVVTSSSVQSQTNNHVATSKENVVEADESATQQRKNRFSGGVDVLEVLEEGKQPKDLSAVF